MTSQEFLLMFKSVRLELGTEKKCQASIEAKLKKENVSYLRESFLDEKQLNQPDFMIGGLCIEVKIKGDKKAIYKQLERYAAFNQVKEIVLVTNKAAALPKFINNKLITILNIGKAWL